MSLQLVIAPDSRLQKQSSPVQTISHEIQSCLMDILKTLYHHNAIGLCGAHVGIDLQLVVIDLNGNHPIFMVNPMITNQSDETIISNESSVSFPGITVPIMRHKSVTVEYLDYDGNKKIEVMHDLLSICAQHEIDQMNGINILSGFSPMQRDRYLKKVEKYVRIQKKNNIKQ
jgi:peptide deformylase